MTEVIKTPTKYFLVEGASEGQTELNSFDYSLLEAGIGDTNLVRMSSILPPNCQEIEPENLPYGALVPIAYAYMTSKKKGALITAVVAVGIPEDDSLPGLIMEHHSDKNTLEEAEAITTKMVMDGFEYRNRKLSEIKLVSSSIIVQDTATAFAGLVLWD